MIVSKKYIYSILNELANVSDTIQIKYPPIGHLFSLWFGEKCKLKFLPEADYRKMREGFLRIKKGAIPDKEIPLGNDFRTCLYASGIIQSDTQEELNDIISEGIERNLLKGKKPLFIGYDTNALSDRLNRKIEEIIALKTRNNKPQIGYCLSEGVEKELQDNLDKKYDFEDLKKLKLPCMGFTNKFINQPPKKSRMAYLGAVEFKKILANPNCELIDTDRKGDEAIVNSYKKYEKAHDVELLLLTGDNNFTSRAQTQRIRTLYMKKPSALQNSEPIYCEYKNLCELIFCTAIIFGYIEFGGIEIYGIWKGKTSEDWDAERLNIEIKDAEIKKKVKRDLQVIETAERALSE